MSTIDDEIASISNVPNWQKNDKTLDLEIFNSISYNDLSELNNTLVKITQAMVGVNKKLSTYERIQAKTEVQYKRKYRYLLLNSKMSTDSQKKLYAETQCEDLEMKIIYSKEIINELKRTSNTLRNILEIIQTLGNNVRKEMGLI